MNPPLSPMALALLRGHQPNVAAYLSQQAVGGTFREDDLIRIDKAYEELARAGLMQRTAATTLILPRVERNTYLLTPDGIAARKALR
ncbi:MAG TPA: hypothetical protein VKD71_04885 [Gemmataceae bacterium]|nr:hypothetical protein [Gemmataceae bacterium]